MNGTARQAFTLAKVYGMFAHSFVGDNFRDLLRLKTLADLQERLSPGRREAAAESLDAAALELQINRGAIASMTYVLDLLGKPPEILVHILRKAEYENLKIVLRRWEVGGSDPGALEGIQDLGRYAGLPLGSLDYEGAIRKSPYAWILGELRNAPRQRVESLLDRDYYSRLLHLAEALPTKGRSGVLRFVRLEVALTNVIWALRLRFFFAMNAESALPLLMPTKGDSLRKAVRAAFEIPPEAVDEWRRWKFGWLLDGQWGGTSQAPDPVRAEIQASHRIAVRAHQLLHQYPFTVCPLVAYFVLKQRESAALKTVVEGIQLSIPEKELLSLAGEP